MALLPGDPVPWFSLPSPDNPAYAFHSVAGRYVLLCAFGAASRPESQAALKAVAASPRPVSTTSAPCFFGLSAVPCHRAPAGAQRHHLAPDSCSTRRRCLPPPRPAAGRPGQGRRRRAVHTPPGCCSTPCCGDRDAPLADAGAILARLRGLPPPEAHAGTRLTPPVLVLPRIFEPEFCRALIAHYDGPGGTPSGFMREVDGKTVGAFDPAMKRRKDCTIADEALRAAARHRLVRRVVPELLKAYHFRATRMERDICRLLRIRGSRPFRPASRQHHRRHRASPLRGHHQPERRGLRGRGTPLPRIRHAVLAGADRGCRGVLLLAAPPGAAGHRRPPLRLPALPLRRSRREAAGGEQRQAGRRGRSLSGGSGSRASIGRGACALGRAVAGAGISSAGGSGGRWGRGRREFLLPHLPEPSS